MRVLGVDPGSRITGYGLLEEKNRQISFIEAGLIKLPEKMPFPRKIHRVFQGIVELLERFGPDAMAVEDLFYAKNARSSLKLGHARGAILAAAGQHDISVFEYTPLEIKKSVVGYGRADKEQVRSMVNAILGLKKQVPIDASDALATAICHINSSRLRMLQEKSRGK
ncbi:MAG: crossover junction endodeoxyribonuclease RuvC [Deltaproteobacteria bacterium]|nr:crossover junction endodeoxyribonuclease RuvC [Deltaproteobacteria bacterium]